jgi:2-polyprenyl-6-methoxyphenol hydroxylase-like FAD-dependent oxidoreductase
VGSGLVIQPVGQAVLAEIGVLDQALELGTPINRMRGGTAPRRQVLNVSYDPAQRRFGLGIHRASLFATLLSAARAAGATLHPAHAALSTEDGCITFASHRAGPFHLIVDAAGAGSPLTPLRARPLPFGAVWATVPWPIDTDLDTDVLSQRYKNAAKMAGVLPIGQLPGDPTPLAAIFWSLRSDRYQDWRDTPLSRWKAQATDLWPAFAPFLAGLSSHDDLTLARYAHGTLRNPVGPGLARIGDAAHQASPQLGQGANMALLDASALADAMKGRPVELALRHYARSRRSHLAVYQLLSRFLTPLYQSDHWLPPLLRDRVFAPLVKIPPAPRILARLVSGDLVRPIRR